MLSHVAGAVVSAGTWDHGRQPHLCKSGRLRGETWKVGSNSPGEGEESVSDKYEAMFHAGHTARASERLGCKVLAGRVGAGHGQCERRVGKFGLHHLGGGESRPGQNKQNSDVAR